MERRESVIAAAYPQNFKKTSACDQKWFLTESAIRSLPQGFSYIRPIHITMNTKYKGCFIVIVMTRPCGETCSCGQLEAYT